MLSYRHGFHAGNHADVLKHLVQTLVLEHLLAKEKPLRYIDTHSATGGYTLNSAFSEKTSEWQEGIGRLWQQSDLPESVTRYLDVVAAFNNYQDNLKLYPGSPSIAADLLRPYDKLALFELHGTDFRDLKKNFKGDRRVSASDSDGFHGLISLLPPVERRAFVLIDPPYEVKDDYNTVVKTLKGAMQRFATGVHAGTWPTHRRYVRQRYVCDQPAMDAGKTAERGSAGRLQTSVTVAGCLFQDQDFWVVG